MRKKFNLKYDFFKNYSSNKSNSLYSNTEIKSDFKLILILFKELLIYILMLIPNILFLFFSFFSSNKNKSSEYFEKIFLEPFKILGLIFNWFFEARITAYLILFLIIVFFLQIVFLTGNQVLLNSLMDNPNHFLNENYWGFFTSIFLHANLYHLLSNCFILLIFGRIVEKQLKNKTLFIFLGSGIISSLISNILNYYLKNFNYSLGASGAICGIIIFAIFFKPFTLSFATIIPLPIFILGWISIGLDLFGFFNPNNKTDFSAHLGGYFALIILFFLLEFKQRKKILKGFIINILMLIIFALFYFFYLNKFLIVF